MYADQNTIGARIRHARKRKGLNQTELGALIGVSQPSIANWEKGAHGPRDSMLEKMAVALGVAPAWLKGGGGASDHATARHIRAGLRHAPIIKLSDSLNLIDPDGADPFRFAQDFIAIGLASNKLFAFYTDDVAMTPAFPLDTIVVVDYGDRKPEEGMFCVADLGGAPALRCWKGSPPRLEPCVARRGAPKIPGARARIIGRAKASIQFH
ncbi:MAG: helix-turn-helix transcriptional regulator [Pseudomonadota bacterium]